MNRRRFLQSLVAVFALPTSATLSLQSAAAPAVAAVPAHARSWAIYMSTLHGECTPQTLQKLLNIPEVDAKRYVGQLVADGVIKSNPFLQRSVSQILGNNDDSLLGKVKKRLEMKTQVQPGEVDNSEAADTAERVDAEAELSEDISEADLEVTSIDDPEEPETPVEAKVQN